MRPPSDLRNRRLPEYNTVRSETHAVHSSPETSRLDCDIRWCSASLRTHRLAITPGESSAPNIAFGGLPAVAATSSGDYPFRRPFGTCQQLPSGGRSIADA